MVALAAEAAEVTNKLAAIWNEMAIAFFLC